MIKKTHIQRAIHYIDISRLIMHHVVGPHHSIKHRKMVGLSVVTSGASIIVFTAMSHILALEIIGSIIGPLLHTIGFIPFVTPLEKRIIEEELREEIQEEKQRKEELIS